MLRCYVGMFKEWLHSLSLYLSSQWATLCYQLGTFEECPDNTLHWYVHVCAQLCVTIWGCLRSAVRVNEQRRVTILGCWGVLGARFRYVRVNAQNCVTIWRCSRNAHNILCVVCLSKWATLCYHLGMLEGCLEHTFYWYLRVNRQHCVTMLGCSGSSQSILCIDMVEQISNAALPLGDIWGVPGAYFVLVLPGKWATLCYHLEMLEECPEHTLYC